MTSWWRSSSRRRPNRSRLSAEEVRLLEALHHAERALQAGPREPRMTQEQLRELQQLQAARDKTRLAL